jgi:hypothetical protein
VDKVLLRIILTHLIPALQGIKKDLDANSRYSASLASQIQEEITNPEFTEK